MNNVTKIFLMILGQKWKLNRKNLKAMKIETLFNVGDEVHYLQGTKLKENVIHSIDTETRGDGTKIRYCFKDKQTTDWEFANESEVFETLDEFTKQLQS